MKNLKVFIAGPRAINELNENVCKKLNNICEKKYEILIGDSFGIDSKVQNFLNNKQYKKVTVYASGNRVRNNYGNWIVQNVSVNSNEKGFDFYAHKDLEMAKNADIGFMIWNGNSRGTFNNIVNLLQMNKEVVLYYEETKSFYDFKCIEDFIKCFKTNIMMNNKLKQIVNKIERNKFVQVGLF